jgi:hypothetical protein
MPEHLANRPAAVQRIIFAACAADPRSPLSRTQRAAVFSHLGNLRWHPTREECPQTYAAVEAWYEAQYRERRGRVETVDEGVNGQISSEKPPNFNARRVGNT